ncbi:MAG TPA: class I SAM-dependent methyltransferase [Candidatus Cloacimonadota bacterium]|jgi:predicted O-methyltransferase YrrM|nr:class I SAM-dependent methyltransferase [Candidatus Cloacimonadales bacterium]HPY95600.1 class I SAM-dependent methyltransferase [Candidatus Cloacimonadota bacterium]HQB40168.1 class I SAM-dependent methyltransferase [Candidatus Cloacimonadota bacterium]
MEKLKQQYINEFAQFDKQKSEIRRLWNIDPESAKLLFFLVQIKKPKHILEIGTSNGFSSFMMSVACQNDNCLIDTIEVDEKRFNMATKNLKSRKNIIIHFGKAEDIIPSLDCTYDFVFIDANKKSYINYIQQIIPKLDNDAVIIADNINSHQETTIAYKQFITASNSFTTMQLSHEAGLLISIYKKSS